MVLVAVLWMVAALSIVVMGITRSVREEARKAFSDNTKMQQQLERMQQEMADRHPERLAQRWQHNPLDTVTRHAQALWATHDAGSSALAASQLSLHALASGVLPGQAGPAGVVFETKSGPLAIRAKNIVDCTGDGDVAAALASLPGAIVSRWERT